MSYIIIVHDKRKSEFKVDPNTPVYNKEEAICIIENGNVTDIDYEIFDQWGAQMFSESKSNDWYIVDINNNNLHVKLKEVVTPFLRNHNIDKILK